MTILLLSIGITVAALAVAAFFIVPAIREMKTSAVASRESVERMRLAWEPVADEKTKILDSISRLQAALADRERAAAALSEIAQAKEKIGTLSRFVRNALSLKRTISGGGVSSMALILAETLLAKRRNNK